jgi:hypothetical protein
MQYHALSLAEQVRREEEEEEEEEEAFVLRIKTPLDPLHLKISKNLGLISRPAST